MPLFLNCSQYQLSLSCHLRRRHQYTIRHKRDSLWRIVVKVKEEGLRVVERGFTTCWWVWHLWKERGKERGWDRNNSCCRNALSKLMERPWGRFLIKGVTYWAEMGLPLGPLTYSVMVWRQPGESIVSAWAPWRIWRCTSWRVSVFLKQGVFSKGDLSGPCQGQTVQWNFEKSHKIPWLNNTPFLV